MFLSRPVALFRATFIALLLAPLLIFAADFAHETSDLTVDPAIKWGKLDNGLRYALLKNSEPKGRISARLAIKVGSLYENEDQRGVAHFLEHMAFNGSKHFPSANVIEFFQKLGMEFGGDTNASTSFDRTIYQLELPDTKTETLHEALTYFSDVAGGLLLESKEIDKERGIILSEKRARDSVGLRTFLAELNFLIPDSRFPQRLPIGTEEVIRGAARERFVEFYDAWYRPERMVLVIVGDIDPEKVEATVKEIFAPLAARAPALPEPRLGTVVPPENVIAGLHTEMEAGSTNVGLQTVVPYSHEVDNAANRLKYLPRTLALRMLNRRLSILAKKENAPFVSGMVGVTEQFEFFRNASIELNCRPDQWREALEVAEQELRRALEHGFQADELAESIAELSNNLQQAVRTAPTRRSGPLADDIVDDVLDRSVPTHPVVNLELYKPALASITTKDCTEALREAWNETNGRKIFVSGNLQLSRAPQNIAAAYNASTKIAVAAPPENTQSEFAYTDFGKPGEVEKTEVVEDLGATLIRFKNNVRLNLKPTDFESGRIRISVRIGGGVLTMPLDKPGLTLLANSTFTPGGLGKHSVDDLQRLLAGKTVGLGFGAQTDAFTFSGSTNRDDLLLQLQLFCAFITDPGYRPEAMRQMQKGAEQLYNRLAHTLEGPLQLEFSRLLASGDVRFGLPPKDVLLSRNTDELKSWLSPQFAKGPIEIAIVGDFDPDATVTAVAQTFGALPKRAKKPDYDKARKVSKPAEPLVKSYEVATEIPKGLVQLYWPATDARDVKIARRFRLLADVLADRLRVKIREQMGGTYSPNAGADLSDTYPNYGFIAASATVAPDEARAIADAMKAAAASLYTDGVTEEELVRVKQPILTGLRESSRTNPYWLGSVLSSAQEFPERLDWSRTRYSDNESVTAEELTALAKQYLDPAKTSEVIVLPAPKAEPAAQPTTSETPTPNS
ncbi:M16 family metallopeptidase [Oleiharenicola lentus]|uniref:M16 family metallopeptidase n=1 Tax=Oleiharenicola lentus TaxID=2508720 RepID=UPI003F66DB1E